MKYFIQIDQKRIAERFPSLDLVDAAILNYIQAFITNPKMHRILAGGRDYFWLDHGHICLQMPLLRINTGDGIYRRLQKLAKCGIIEPFMGNKAEKKSFYTQGHRWMELIADGDDIGSKSEVTSDQNPIYIGQPSDLTSDENPMDTSIKDKIINKQEGAPVGAVGHDPLDWIIDKREKPKSDPKQAEEPKAKPEKILKKPEGKKKHADPKSFLAMFAPDEFRHDDAFVAAWDDWGQNRIEAKNPLNERAAKLAINKLIKFPVAVAIEALEKSTMSGWTGVFPESIAQGGRNGKFAQASSEQPKQDFGF